ncbi:hypothetical protein MMC19_003132 [Ptychographa xylographoides]|nr:hypothetical protein [Ptychographa xylographoides]
MVSPSISEADTEEIPRYATADIAQSPWGMSLHSLQYSDIAEDDISAIPLPLFTGRQGPPRRQSSSSIIDVISETNDLLDEVDERLQSLQCHRAGLVNLLRELVARHDGRIGSSDDTPVMRRSPSLPDRHNFANQTPTDVFLRLGEFSWEAAVSCAGSSDRLRETELNDEQCNISSQVNQQRRPWLLRRLADRLRKTFFNSRRS